MKKKICIISLIILLFWFFLDMIGITIDGNILVTRAYKEDGIFFVIFFLLLSFFMIKPKIGYILLTGWLFMWLITQFLSHWYYTIFGSSEQKIAYFSNTIKLIHSSNIYIPDLYHIILHILILISLINMIGLCRDFNKTKKKIKPLINITSK